MPRSKDYLNEKQLDVLRWIERGRPSGHFPAGDFAHRITAQALASRGLVTITGRGATWTATVTPGGTEQLSRDETDSDTARKSITNGAQLIADVIAAGGVLDVSASSTMQTDWETLIRNANQSTTRPHGQTLVRTFDAPPGRVVLRFKTNYWETTPKGPVNVPQRVRQHHPAVQAYVQDKDWHYVTRDHLRRAVHLLDAVAREGEARGMIVRRGQPWWTAHQTWQQSRRTGSHLTITHHHRSYELVVREIKGQGSVRREPSVDAKRAVPRWQEMQQWTFVPSGKLEIELRGAGLSDFTMRDTRSQSLEQQLPRLLQAFDVAVLEADDLDRIVADRAESQRRQWESAMTQARTRWEHARRVEIIDKAAKQWEQRQRVTTYVEAISAQGPGAVDAQWLTWAQSWIDGFDGIPSLDPFELPEPRPADLQPYLRGWSALGPNKPYA